MKIFRRIAPLFVLIAATGFCATASAHPLDEGRQEVVFSIKDGHLEWTHDLWLGPLIAMPLWARDIDSNQDQVMSADEREAYARRFADEVQLNVDGQRVPVSIASVDVAPYRKFVSQPAEPQVSVVFTAPITSGEHALAYITRLNPEQIKLSGRFPSGGGVRVQNPSNANSTFAATADIKPEAMLPRDADVPASAMTTPAVNTSWLWLAGLISAVLAGAGCTLILVLWRAHRTA